VQAQSPSKQPEAVEQRAVLGDALVRLGATHPNLVVLSPDVSRSTGAIKFKTAYPERFICTGISEQNTIGVAAGLAMQGWIPLVAAQSIFIAGKGWEPFRQTVAYPHLNVKIVGTHGGINVGPDGVSHQAIEDIAIMRVIPGVVVLAPTDGNQVFSVLRAAIDEPGPVFIRLERSAIPLITREADPIHIGGSNTLVEGNDAAVIAIGSMAVAGVEAANLLAHEGVNVRVISMVSIKPIDEAAIIRSARDTGALVVAEDHNCNAGLGGAVAEVVVRTVPVPIEQVAVRDIFAESGQADELREKYHLTSYDIGRAVRRVMERREQLGWASR